MSLPEPPATPAPLRPAATILLLRDGADGLEVWLMERARSVAFMPRAWVFPGGRVDPGDGELPVDSEPAADLLARVPRPFWAAALRELEEEAGVRIGGAGYDLARLSLWAHWITPEVEPRRFDTWFFAARAPADADPRVDGSEAVNGGWYAPNRAIELCQEGSLPVAPPTLRTLFELSAHADVATALSAPRPLAAIMPRFLQRDDALYVLLPGDPEHPSPEAVDPPYRYAFDAGRWWARLGPNG